MRASHVVTVGICAGMAALVAGFAGCGTDTFGSCTDTNSCGDDGGDGSLTNDSATGGDTSTGDDTGTGEGSVKDGPGSDAKDAAETGPTCDSGIDIVCSGVCVNPLDVNHCGNCTNVCFGPEAGPGHPVCQPGGQCAIACDSDAGDAGATEILCSGACVSPNDPTHCGTCTHTCAAPPSGNGSAVCPAAACGVSCNPGFHGAGAACNTDCLPNGGDPSGDPCVVADGLGTFVAPTGSDATGDGTKEKPFGTIGHAMAATTTLRVYACGVFTAEQLVVGPSVDGVKVFGGFDCATWAYSASTKTKLAPTVAGFALQINGLVTGVTFEDFEFDSITTTTPGGSSQAVLVNASQNVTFRRSAIVAGSALVTAANGTNGTNPWSGIATGGNSASSTTPDHGGPTQSNCTCGGTGGQGGNAGTWNSGSFVVAQPGATGGDGTIGAAINAGAGAHQGAGGPPSIVPCTPGTAGGSGAPGSGGAGGTSPGTLSVSGWSNLAGVGAAGQPAGPAQGGGGGGGGLYDPAVSPGGLGGSAGGGCGGCGGAGAATGGSAGGSSIALIVVTSTITLDSCVLTAAAGGAGGQGGNGQAGQSGGPPGSPATSGCNGGSGGTGGTGGAGGGGAGGNSIGIAYTGTAPTQVGTVTISVATTAAAGGAAGAGISSGASHGAAGLSVATQSF